jgi:hypothetical protein
MVKKDSKRQVIKSSSPLIHKSKRFYHRLARAKELNGKDKFHFSFGYLQAQIESLREFISFSTSSLVCFAFAWQRSVS